MEYSKEVVQLFYEYGKSPTTVRKLMKKKYPDTKYLSRNQIYRIVKRFEESGTVLSRWKGHSGRKRSGRSEENIEEVKNVMEETPRKSIRSVMREVTNTASYSSVQRILKYDLKLKPYKIAVMQHLKDRDIDTRMEFANWALENPEVINNIWFSDEAHFYMDGAVNKQNLRFWSESKPEFYEEKTLHSQHVTAWAAMSSSGIIGPYFFEERGETTTVSTDRYLGILDNKFIPELTRRGYNTSETWFQQDGAAPHTATDALNWLDTHFGDNVISLKTLIEWPPHSPDLNPLDFFLWGHLKEHVYSPPPTDLKQLKAAIVRKVKQISIDTCRAVIVNFNRRIGLVIQKKGGHIEHTI